MDRCERCGNDAHSTAEHIRELAHFRHFREKKLGFDTDTFVYNVQTLDNETLITTSRSMQEAFEQVVTGSWHSRLKAAWMLGVYEREIKHRGLC